jgi:hypothetical protein
MLTWVSDFEATCSISRQSQSESIRQLIQWAVHDGDSIYALQCVSRVLGIGGLVGKGNRFCWQDRGWSYLGMRDARVSSRATGEYSGRASQILGVKW